MSIGETMATATKQTIRVQVDQCCPSVLGAALREPDAHELARAFAALGDPVRLRLLSLIAAAGECCSCDLEAPLGKAQPTISHHTKALAEAGLIAGEKRGRWTWWKVVPERMAALCSALVPAE
jgi:ArsR family transcriptional regulator, arsenate/arsenite/antimonite-responsive transcriptional repressor